MTPELIAEIGTHIADVAATDGGTINHIEITEMADGSRRTCALLTMLDGEHEQVYRIVSPSPWNSPAWAAGREWEYSVRIISEWASLEVPA